MESVKPVLCDRCRRRPARILRRLTRQRLCLQCHFDYLVRTSKRNFSHLKNIPPRTPAFVPMVPWMPLESLLLLKIVARIEKKHGSRAWAVLLSDGDGEPQGNQCREWANKARQVVEEEFNVVNVRAPGMLTRILGPGQPKVSRWRRLRAVLSEVSKKLGGGLVVLPACMEFLVSLEVSGYLRALPHPLGEARPTLSSPVVRGFVNGFYGVPCAETTLHSLMISGDARTGPAGGGLGCGGEPGDVVDETSVGLVFDTVAEHSFEVLFSIQKSSLALTRPGSTSSCRLCGGVSTGELCTWCSSISSVLGELVLETCEQH